MDELDQRIRELVNELIASAPVGNSIDGAEDDEQELDGDQPLGEDSAKGGDSDVS
jgi:hypothetical protein